MENIIRRIEEVVVRNDWGNVERSRKKVCGYQNRNG